MPVVEKWGARDFGFSDKDEGGPATRRHPCTDDLNQNVHCGQHMRRTGQKKSEKKQSLIFMTLFGQKRLRQTRA
jgi:hypothetical protein